MKGFGNDQLVFEKPLKMTHKKVDTGGLIVSERDDEELEMLLEEIPQVTSAPPLPHGRKATGTQTLPEPASEPNSTSSGSFYALSSNSAYDTAPQSLTVSAKDSPQLVRGQRSILKGPLMDDRNGSVNNQNDPEHSFIENRSLAAAFSNLRVQDDDEGSKNVKFMANNGKVLDSKVPATNHSVFDVNKSSLTARLSCDNDSFRPPSRTMTYGIKQSSQVNNLQENGQSEATRKYLKPHPHKDNSYRTNLENAFQNPQNQQQSFMSPFVATSNASSYHVPINNFIRNREITPFLNYGYLDRPVGSNGQSQPCRPKIPYQDNTVQLAWQQMEDERRLRMQQEYMLTQQAQGYTSSGLQNQRGTTMLGDPSNRILGQHCLCSPRPNLIRRNMYHGNSQLEGAAINDPEGSKLSSLPCLVNSNNPWEYPASNGNICRYFAQGFCSRGQACPFSHGLVQRIVNGRSSNPTSVSYKNQSVTGISDFEERTVFPEKILTRNCSRGINFITTINAANTGHLKDYSGHNGYSNGTTSSNGFSLSGSFHLDPHGQSRSVSPDVADLEIPFRSLTSSPQHQAKYSSLDELQGRIYLVAKDQHGCRFLQRIFDDGSTEDIEKIFGEIIEHIIELMTDPFGNYLVQKLLDVCSEDQRIQILHVVTRKPNELVNISLSMHGTRAVQKLIESLQTPREVSLVVSSLRSGVVTLIKDLNGNHVVQRCLQRLSSEDNMFLFDAAVEHCVEIATHRHGCCVLQRCIDHSSGSQRERLVAEAAANALELSQDAYGNYVVQYILDLEEMHWERKNVMKKLEGNYTTLSMQKFSSNVVEKCLKIAAENERAQIVHELINGNHLGQLLQDPYANYVVQCALSVCKGSLHSALVDAIRPHLPTLRSSPFGKRILSRATLRR